MSGYELTAFGPVPLGTPYLDPKLVSPEQAAKFVVRADYGNGDSRVLPMEEAAKTQVLTPPPVVVAPQPPPSAKVAQAAAAPAVPAAAGASLGSVIKAAKSRVKDIKAELEHHRVLQKELAELERLLKAAKQKPTSVRPLRSVG